MRNLLHLNVLGVDVFQLTLDCFSFVSPGVFALNMGLRFLDLAITLLCVLADNSRTEKAISGSAASFFFYAGTTAALWHFVTEANTMASPIWSYLATSALIYLGTSILAELPSSGHGAREMAY